MTSLKQKLLEIRQLAESLPERLAFKPQGKYTGTTPSTPTGGRFKHQEPGAAAPAGGRFKHQVPGTTTTAPTGATIPAVKAMQEAMQKLADAVMRDAHTATMARRPGEALQPEAGPEVVAAKKSFNDFIAEQYVGALGEDKKGVEWTTVPGVTAVPEKQRTQTDIYELDAVMDTFRRIGMGSKEFTPDGQWGPRTDNALRNMMGFAYSLMQLEGDFGLKTTAYHFKNWQELHQLLSGYEITDGKISLSPQEQNERATEITKHLNAISKMYDQFRLEVTGRPEFRPLLEGKRSFEKYDTRGSAADALSPTEQALARMPTAKVTGVTLRAPGLPGGMIDNIPLYALQSKEDFNKFLKYCGWTDENIEAGIGTKLLNGIKQQIEAK